MHAQEHHLGRLVSLENGDVVRLKEIMLFDREFYIAQPQRVIGHYPSGVRRWGDRGQTVLVHAGDTTNRNGYCPWHSGDEAEAKQCVNPHDHCEHGVYVGGCGPDYMCGPCEMGGES
jgi:hypothetical protein